MKQQRRYYYKYGHRITASGRDYVRELVRIRDGQECLVCSGTRAKNKNLDCHHLDGKTESTRKCNKTSETQVMITLCHKCHMFIFHRKDNPYMRIFFTCYFLAKAKENC